MARPKTKMDLIEAANKNFEKLWQIIDSMPEKALKKDLDFSDDPKLKEAHWKRDKNLRDILIHLFEWHRLLLNWIESNTAGKSMPFLPEPYNWKNYGKMNIEFWEKHQSTVLEDAKDMVKDSHNAVLVLLKPFTDEELFTKRHFDWTGTTTLGSYCVSAMSSHYDWAIKKLRLHIKMVS